VVRGESMVTSQMRLRYCRHGTLSLRIFARRVLGCTPSLPGSGIRGHHTNLQQPVTDKLCLKGGLHMKKDISEWIDRETVRLDQAEQGRELERDETDPVPEALRQALADTIDISGTLH
jgi:hypothetical protein